MGDDIRVTTDDLATTEAICTLQASHLLAIGKFVKDHCRIDPGEGAGFFDGGDMGLMLKPFVGVYRDARENAENGFTSAQGVATGIADGLKATVQDYSTMEQEAAQGFQDMAPEMCVYVPPSSSVADRRPTPVRGHDAIVPPWVKGSSAWIGQRTGDVSKARKIAEAPGKSMAWDTDRYSDLPSLFGKTTPPEEFDSDFVIDSVTKGIEGFKGNPKNWVKGGTTWIEDKYREHHGAKDAGVPLEEYRSTTRPRQLEERFDRAYDAYRERAVDAGLVTQAELKDSPSLITASNFKTISGALDAGTSTVSLVTGTVDVLNGADKVIQATDRNARVQSVANGGGYGDASLAGMGIPVPKSLQEIENPLSAISSVPATTEKNIGESLRWKAGLLLGGLDWLISQIMNPGPIERLVKPFAGDWCALDVTRQCWGRAGAAVTSVGHNFEGLPRMLSSWNGAAKTAFTNRMDEISSSLYDFSNGCYAMSDVTAALIDLGKVVGEFIAGILGVIGDWLTRLAIEAAIPVFGWIGGAIDVAATAVQVATKVQKGLDAIQRFLDAIEKVLKVIKMINKIISVIKTLEKAMTALANMSTVSASKGATDAAFAIS